MSASVSMSGSGSSPAPALKVVVAGAGIGGLTAALALLRRGFEVQIFEQADALRPLGAGLSLWSNAIACLSALGLDESLRRRGAVLERAEIRTQAGGVLAGMDVGEFGRRVGYPAICIRRGALQEILLAALPNDVLHLGHKLVRWEEQEQAVTLHFENGRSARGDVLIGADGLRSTVRAAVRGDAPPRYAGYGGWLGLARFTHESFPEGLVFESWGCGSRFGMLHCGEGYVYWFAVRNCSQPLEGVRPGRKADVLRLAHGWHEPIPAVIEATPEQAILELPFFDRPPADAWGRGRVTLLGDAAHPMTPNVGQGACQAIEDALTLAACLAQATEPAQGLRTYEERRQRRTAKIVRKSWNLGKLAQSENRLVCWGRNLLVKATPRSRFIRQMGEVFQASELAWKPFLEDSLAQPG